MAFPTTGTLDDFNRADSGPPLSGSWGGKLFSGDTSGCTIVSNQAQCNANQSDYWTTSYGPDCEVYATLPAAFIGGLFARVSNPGTGTFSGYEVYVSGATNVVQVYRIDNGGYVQLGADFTQAFTNGDSVGMSVIGPTITVYYKVGAGAWTSLGTRTDSTYTGAGYLGMEGDGASTKFDDFGGGTIPSTASVLPYFSSDHSPYRVIKRVVSY